MEELSYSVRRADWLRKHHGWESLWVIFYNMTREDYDALRATDYRLPDLTKRFRIYEYLDDCTGSFCSWPHCYNIVKTELLAVDAFEGAVEKWKSFVVQRLEQDRGIPVPEGSEAFPRPTFVCKETGEKEMPSEQEGGDDERGDHVAPERGDDECSRLSADNNHGKSGVQPETIDQKTTRETRWTFYGSSSSCYSDDACVLFSTWLSSVS